MFVSICSYLQFEMASLNASETCKLKAEIPSDELNGTEMYSSGDLEVYASRRYCWWIYRWALGVDVVYLILRYNALQHHVKDA